jgi:Fe-S cluster assembly protein SufD
MSTQTVQPQEGYLDAFAEFERDAATGPSWLTPLRKAAISRFREVGFPTRHNEEWRFTNPAVMVETNFQPAKPGRSAAVTAAEIAPFTFPEMGATTLVFVDGSYVPALSSRGALPQGVTVSSLAEAFAAHHPAIEPHLARYAKFDTAFPALNTAFLSDGAFVHIPRSVVVAEPIHLLFVSTASATPTVSYPRTLIVAEENSQTTVVESYAGIGDEVSLTNAVTEIVVAQDANLDHYKLNRESRTAYHVATMQVQMAKQSVFSSHSINLGGLFVRNDANALLGAEYAECTLNGLSLVDGKRLVDNHTAIDHALPNCNSHELYKYIMDDQSRGVFNGKIYVREDAQKTDAKQTNQTLLLSADAQINTKPQLEIFADDVKCTHGATIGQLDPEQQFYLQTRGIPKDDARDLLIYAFAGDVISRIKVAALREALDAILLDQLPQR